jgi:hypothetical protein
MTTVATEEERKQLLDFISAAAELRTSRWPLVTHTETRLLAAPTTYDREARTVDCVISVGSPVQRPYGIEKLRITREAVILKRLSKGGIPFLDSHQQVGLSNALGRLVAAWVENGELRGRLAFNDTKEGRKAEGMFARGEVAGLSAGYRVEEWKITDQDGRIIDPEVDRVRADDNLIFEAVRWELLEVSAALIAADAEARVRLGVADQAFPMVAIARANAIARMECRWRMFERQRNAWRNADALARMKSRQTMGIRMAVALGRHLNG